MKLNYDAANHSGFSLTDKIVNIFLAFLKPLSTWIHSFCQVLFPEGPQPRVSEHLYIDVVVGIGGQADDHPRVPLPVEADRLTVLEVLGIVLVLRPQVIQHLHRTRVSDVSSRCTHNNHFISYNNNIIIVNFEL